MLIKGESGFIDLLIKNRRDINTEKLIEVREQLVCGDKHEMMWLDSEKITNGKVELATPPPEFRGYRGGILKYYMQKIKGKYFPETQLSQTKSFASGLQRGIELGMQYSELNAKIKALGVDYGKRKNVDR